MNLRTYQHNQLQNNNINQSFNNNGTIRQNQSNSKSKSNHNSSSPNYKYSLIQRENIKHIRQEEESKSPCRKLVQLHQSLANLEKKKLQPIKMSIKLSRKNDAATNKHHQSIPQSTRSVSSYRNNYTFEKLPRNVNEYQHILLKSKIVAADVSWVLDLRTQYKPNESVFFNKTGFPPSFYDQDVSNYVEKLNKHRKEPSEYTRLSRRPKSYNVDHLVRKRIGQSPNLTQSNFETTLRDFNFKNKDFESSRYSNKKWLTNPNYSQSNFYFSDTFPVITQQSKNIFNKTQKFMLKPLKERITKSKYSEKDSFYSRKVEEVKDSTSFYLGEHLGLENIDIKYGKRNLQGVRHLLDNRKDVKQASVLWEVGLREKFDEINKIKMNRICAYEVKHNKPWSNIFTKPPPDNKEKKDKKK